MTDILDLSGYLNRHVIVVFTSMDAPIEGKLRPALRGGAPSGRCCVIGNDGRFIKRGREIMTFAEEDVLVLIVDGVTEYVKANNPKNGDVSSESEERGKD